MVVEQCSILLYKVIPKELLELFIRPLHAGGTCCVVVLFLLVQELVNEVPETAPVAACVQENKSAEQEGYQFGFGASPRRRRFLEQRLT